MNTACLIVKASKDACATEVDAVVANLRATDSKIVIREVDWSGQDRFVREVGDEKFKIIYLGAHADGTGFGESDHNPWSTWDDLALSICISDCMIPGGILFMGCCRGGMKSIALQIFKVCNRIDYIVGTPQNTKSGDLVPAFNAFARELKSGNPISAAIRATGAVNCHFICHDRQELQVELNLTQQLDRIEERVLDSWLHLIALRNMNDRKVRLPGQYRPRK
jgi:hypothetical protein